MTCQQPSEHTMDVRGAYLSHMRQVANSVAVVTTDGDCGLHGATVSAFCSVSADPPTLLVCLNANSRIARSVSGNGKFCINVLSQELRYMAERFAGNQDAELPDRFDGIDCVHPVGLCPAISNALSFQCDVVHENLSGSHRIFIGAVTGMDGQITQPLIYLDRTFRSISPMTVNTN